MPHFTTTTEISRKGSKIFQEYDEAIVLNNNKDIGLLLGGKLARAVYDSGIIQQIREELYEMQDTTTSNLVKSSKTGPGKNTISLEKFKTKYNV